MAKRLSPKSKSGNRRNPAATAAAQLAEAFHQRPSRTVTSHEEARVEPIELAGLGRLVQLEVKTPSRETFQLDFNGRPVKVTCTPDGGQIYFVDGDQRVDLQGLGLAEYLPKDHITIGQATRITYFTRKGFHNFEPTNYVHKFGEDKGYPPTLHYDVHSERLYLSGGTYQVTEAGIIN